MQCCCGRCLFGNVDGNRRGEGRRLQLFVLLHLQHLRRANMKQKWKVFQWLKQKVFLINVKQKKWEKQLWNITNANDDERKSDKYKISDGERWVKINVKLHGLCLWSGGLWDTMKRHHNKLSSFLWWAEKYIPHKYDNKDFNFKTWNDVDMSATSGVLAGASKQKHIKIILSTEQREILPCGKSYYNGKAHQFHLTYLVISLCLRIFAWFSHGSMKGKAKETIGNRECRKKRKKGTMKWIGNESSKFYGYLTRF